MGNAVLIDVHIIVSENEPWIEECLNSLESEPVNVWFVHRIEGDVRKAREEGFSKGSSEFVSFIDPDDVIVPGIFKQCLDVLHENPDAVGVYTTDELVDVSGNHIAYGWAQYEKPFTDKGFPIELTNGIHHLRVFRRSAVEKCLPLKSRMIPEPLLNAEIQKHGDLIHIPVVGYKWRIHGDNTFLKYKPEEVQEAVEFVRNLWTS
jgi:hypothetical protein